MDARFCSDACRTKAKRAREQEAATKAATTQDRVSSAVEGLGARLDHLDKELGPILQRWPWLVLTVNGWMPVLDGTEDSSALEDRVDRLEGHARKRVAEVRRRSQVVDQRVGSLHAKVQEMDADDSAESYFHRELKRLDRRIEGLESRLGDVVELSTRIVDALAEGTSWR
jgi:hypothetical protein